MDDFVRTAIEHKSPMAGVVIQESFRATLEMEPDSKEEFVFMKIANQMRARLFMASDNRESKIANVLKDLLE